jgi:hypothetical protein
MWCHYNSEIVLVWSDAAKKAVSLGLKRNIQLQIAEGGDGRLLTGGAFRCPGGSFCDAGKIEYTIAQKKAEAWLKKEHYTDVTFGPPKAFVQWYVVDGTKDPPRSGDVIASIQIACEVKATSGGRIFQGWCDCTSILTTSFHDDNLTGPPRGRAPNIDKNRLKWEEFPAVSIPP